MAPHSCTLGQENPMDGGTWWTAVHGVGKSLTRLSDFTFTFHFHSLEKEMASHSSVLAWRIPGTAEPVYQIRSDPISHSVMSDSLCPMDCSMPGFPVHHQHIKLTQTHVIESVMPSNHLILCHPSLLLPPIFPSIRVFSNESVLHIKWTKY